jgi:thiamine biosynthesis lipoprotein
MGCPCEIGVYSTDHHAAGQVLDEVEGEVHRLDQKYSHYREDSYITTLQNRALRAGGVEVDAETAALLDYANTQFELSDGMFDITAGGLTRLWRERKDLPSPESLKDTLAYTGWERLSWRGGRLELPVGMQLELGGVVKEYAADRAALFLKRANIRSAFVELGGDIHVTGPRPDGLPWSMGIRSPERAGSGIDEVFAEIPVYSGGLATSGDYERYTEIDGKRYHHIINPKTGWPVESFCSVSVHAPTCLLAGSISTMAMLMGAEEGLAFLESCGFTWLAYAPGGERWSGA